MQACDTSSIIKGPLREPLDSINIAFMIHTKQSIEENIPSMYENT